MFLTDYSQYSLGKEWVLGEWEVELLSNLNKWISSNEVFAKSVVAFTVIGDLALVWILVSLVCLCFKGFRKTGIYTILAILIVGLLSNNLLIKPLANRARPFYDASITAYPQLASIRTFLENHFFGQFFNLGKMPDSYSFMSGHATASFAAATMLTLNNKKFAVPSYLLAAALAFSRILLGIHWPTDIIFGAVFGTVATIGLYFLLNAIVKAIKKKKGLIKPTHKI